jgi:hypothetical protein
MASCGNGSFDGTSYWETGCPLPEEFRTLPEFTALSEAVQKCIQLNKRVTYIDLTLDTVGNTRNFMFVTPMMFDDWESSITYVRTQFPDLNIPEPDDFQGQYEVYEAPNDFCVDDFEFHGLFYHLNVYDEENYDSDKVTLAQFRDGLKNFTQQQSGQKRYYFT